MENKKVGKYKSKMTEKSKKKVLIVEDDFANAVTALQYFSGQGMNAKIVSTYDQAMDELEEHADEYFGIVSDLNFPQSKGKEPEELGFKLREEAKKCGVPVIILTSGKVHHGGEGYHLIPEFSDEKTKEGPRGVTKEMPEAWADAYEELKKIETEGGLEEIQKARARYKKFTGRQYKKKES